MPDPITDSRIPILWEGHNFISSNDGVDRDGDGFDETRNAGISIDLPIGAQELRGKRITVHGATSLAGNFRQFPFDHRATNRNHVHRTRDQFNQVHAYVTYTSLLDYLTALGLNTSQMLHTFRRKDLNRIEVNVDVGPICNAYYNRNSEDLNFGSCPEMDTPADGDILVHEFGHLVLDHRNPDMLDPANYIPPTPNGRQMYQGEQNAIHEGFADALAAFIHHDPQIAEDSYVFTGNDREAGLRDISQFARFDRNTSSECHERGKIYGNFFWAVKERIADIPYLTEQEAYETALKILWEHARHYPPGRVDREDFVNAILAGMEALAEAGRLPIDPNTLRAIILEEALARNIVTQTFVKAHRAPQGGLALSFSPAQEDGRTLKSAKDVITHFRRKGTALFGAGVESSTAAGERTVYPQLHRTRNDRMIPMLGQGFVENTVKPGGMLFVKANKAVGVTTKNVREIKRNEIDERILVRAADGRGRILRHIRKALIQTRREIKTWSAKPLSSERWQNLSTLTRDEAVLSAVEAQLRRSRTLPSSLVIQPKARTLSHRFELGAITASMDAVTGEITLARNYFAD